MTGRNWHTVRTPVRIGEVTDAMLAPARRAAEESWLPQTVWPSRYFGGGFVGVDCLLTHGCAMFCDGTDARYTLPGAAEGSAPFLTVLPSRYFWRDATGTAAV